MNARKRPPAPLSFDLIDLPEEGKTIELEVSPEEVGLEPEARRWYVSPIAISLHFAAINSGHDLLVTGSFSGEAELLCDRCDASFFWHFEDHSVCHELENAFRRTIDLTEELREDILMVFPQHPLCREDCRGICPVCGVNLNEGTCQCLETEAEDKGTEGQNPWSALDGFSS